MGSTRRATTTFAVVAAIAAASFGVTAAVAQSDGGEVTGSDHQALLERLDALEPQLPVDVLVIEPEVDEEETWGEIQGDATSVRAVLDTVEPDLRRLFVDADDADGEVAEAVALVARGWLDVWTGMASVSAAETHDLAFPRTATDDLDVSTGADELRGSLEIGLELVLQGRSRQLAGYTELRRLGEAEPEAQGRFDERAAESETYDRELRPLVVALLSRPSTVVLVPIDRFETDAPGVRSRAGAMNVVCLDRQMYEEAEEAMTTEELLANLPEAEVDRADCVEEPADLDE